MRRALAGRLDDLGVGDEIVEAAAIGAEDEERVHAEEEGWDEQPEEIAEEARDEVAQQEDMEERGGASILEHHADAHPALANALAGGGAQVELVAGHGEQAHGGDGGGQEGVLASHEGHERRGEEGDGVGHGIEEEGEEARVTSREGGEPLEAGGAEGGSMLLEVEAAPAGEAATACADVDRGILGVEGAAGLDGERG